MKLKDLLIGLVITQIGIHLFYLKNSLSYIWNTISNYSFHSLFDFTNIINQLIGIGFLFFAIAGVIRYFTTQNIYNRALKIFLINQAFSLLVFLPQRILFLFNRFGEDGTPWYQHLFFLLSIGTAIVAILVFSQQKVKVLPAPISRNTVRLLHHFIDRIYLFSSVLAAGSIFIGGHNFFGLDEIQMLIIGYGIIILMPMVYFIICEAGFQQTMGKVATGAYVRSSNGSKAGIGNIIGRSFCRMIPFEAFSYLTDPMSKWHDKFSGTDVFYKSNVVFGEDDSIMDHLVSDEDFS